MQTDPSNADTFLHCDTVEKTSATANLKGDTTASSLQHHRAQPVRCRPDRKPELLARDAG